MRRSAVLFALVGLAFATLGASAVSAAAPPTTTYPVHVGSGATAVVIRARPTRILSLSASATQMLYAIGAGGQVIGVDKYSTYPPNAPRTSFTGAETTAESYVPKNPDLVIFAYDTNHLVEQLVRLHIPALVLAPATTVAGAESQITELGEVTDHETGATNAVKSLNGDLAKIAAPVGSRAQGDTYYVEFSQDLFSATSKSFVGALFSRLGMLNVADAAGHGSAYPQLSAEYLVKANPDYVFLADTVCCGQTATSFAKRPGFARLTAVRDHHVIGVNDSLASEWGPHTMEEFLQVVANAVAAPGRS